jgi:TonB-dependent starch-binding outer membrane protein SusC
MKLHFNVVKGGLLLAAIMLMSNFAMAQRMVKGKVTDAESSDALIGASVSVVGTTRGTVTDIDGNYSVDVPNGATQLRVSYTGYAEQTITLTAANVVNVALANGTQLDEVVVIGYGSVKKKDATGAVSSLNESSFNKGGAISAEQLMQGRAAGVTVTTNSGEPGGGINVRIRGTSSVRNGNGPLYVVDGVPLSGNSTSGDVADNGLGRGAAKNPLNFLNPNDIASIDILKDASATAIYGSRGANGVVIITTKSGSSNKGGIEYAYTLGSSKISKKLNLLGRKAYLDAYAGFNGAAAAASLDKGGDTDWQNEVTQTGISHNHSLSFGKADKSGDYRFSLGYLDQSGIIKETGINRLSGRFNGTQKFINDRLTVGIQATVANQHDDAAPITENSGFEGDLWSNTLKANPTIKPYLADGVTPYQVFPDSKTEPNPIAFLKYHRDFTNTMRGLGNINAELKITNHLTFKTVLGYDRSISARKSAFSKDLIAGTGTGFYKNGRLYTNDIETSNKLWEDYFTYNQSFGKIGFTGLLGYSYQKTDFYQKRSELNGFKTASLDDMIYNTASQIVVDAAGKPTISTVNGSSKYADELQSYFGRAIFNISDRASVTGTLRADGSTKFGDNNKYGYFPSFAAKYRLAQESFLPKIVSDLSVRIGYGITGNQEIPHNLYQERKRYNDANIGENSLDNTDDYKSQAFNNANLKWETTKQTNLGIDFGFADSRVYGAIDLYDKHTSDLLIKVDAAQPAVQPYRWDNLNADVQNRGIELELGVVAVDKSKFDWRINANVAYNKNIVKKYAGLLNTGEINGQGLTGAFAQRIAQNQPLFAFFVRDFDKFENGIAIYKPGDFQQFLGKSPIPKITAGLANSFTYGPFDLNIFFTGQFGHYVYNNTAEALFTAGSLANGRNVTANVLTSGEGKLNAPDVSTYFLEKGDFIRLQDVTLGYNLKPMKKSISNIRVFVNATNLWLNTKYSGQDPEVNTNKALQDVPSLGIDYNAYPKSRTISVGANISFN